MSGNATRSWDILRVLCVTVVYVITVAPATVYSVFGVGLVFQPVPADLAGMAAWMDVLMRAVILLGLWGLSALWIMFVGAIRQRWFARGVCMAGMVGGAVAAVALSLMFGGLHAAFLMPMIPAVSWVVGAWPFTGWRGAKTE